MKCGSVITECQRTHHSSKWTKRFGAIKKGSSEVKANVDPHETYFPGHDVVDIFATDVYTQGFDSLNYAQLLALAGDKPLALGEVERAPTVEIWRDFMQAVSATLSLKRSNA
jgi:hypothetical protein